MLSLDVIALGVPEVQAARAFYASALSPAVANHGDYVGLDLHGTGEIGLLANDALAEDAGANTGTDTGTASVTSGFRGYLMNVIVRQPNEVEALMDAAANGGAKVIKPAKKRLFGEFAAMFEAPDGSVWKLAAESGKNAGPAGSTPSPIETLVIIGVAAPKKSRAFYEALGMTVDRDYGDQYLDFRHAPGSFRLALMTHKDLTKEAKHGSDGAGFRGVVLNRRAESRQEVDATLAEAASAGGTITVPAAEEHWGGYTGHFTDPDGFAWKVACVG